MSNITKTRGFALALSVLLCAILYLSFLKIGFTEYKELETYICFTTESDVHFHSAICTHTNNKKVSQTTVYEACGEKYEECSKCNPCVEQYKTTIHITERNYVAPAIISILMSTIIFIALTTIKTKRRNKNV